MSRLLVAVIALSVAACTEWGAGPDISGATQNGVSIRYDATQIDPREAEDVAREYCQGLDKAAKLRSHFGDSPELTYAVYGCVHTGE